MHSLSKNKKITVNYFQRKPRKGFNFSIEFIFDLIREKLADKIEANIIICKLYNDGYYSKLINVINAAFSQKNDVAHITGEVHFLDLFMKSERVILTIHDCGMMGRKTGMAKHIVRLLYLSWPVKKARIITTVSEATKLQIMNFTLVAPDKIKVIPVPLNSLFQPDKKTFNEQKPVILQIGTGYNKNVLRLIEALNGVSCHLVIIGKLSEEQKFALFQNNIDHSNVYNISDQQMLTQYKQCDMVSFISTSEGFGMPIIEANSVERVVITSNISSMPEVAGDAALLVDPFDIAAIRRGILHLIQNSSLRNELINKGKINKLRFDPDKIALMYLDLYRQIASN